MSNCPDRETLERLLNEELDPKMNTDILSHLSVCDSCRNTVKCYMEEEVNLLEKLFEERIVSESKGAWVSQSSNRCLSRALLLAYSSSCLNGEQAKAVESHLETCNKCLRNLIALQSAAAATLDLDLDLSDMAPAAPSMDKPRIGMFDLVLKVKNDMLELLRHTGEVLSAAPGLAVVRGSAKPTSNSIVVREDFDHIDLSLEIAVPKDFTQKQSSMRISLMNKSNERFLPGTKVSLVGPKSNWEGTTDEEGIVEFSGITVGRYQMVCEGETIASITIE